MLFTQNPLGRIRGTKRMYYTGKDINSTDGSRTAYAVDLIPDTVVQEDKYNFEGNGPQATVGRPTAGILEACYLVTRVPDASKRGGWIDVVPIICGEQVVVNGAVTNGAYLQIKSGTTKFEAGTPTTVAHLLAPVGATNAARPFFVAQEANSSGDKLIRVSPAFGLAF
jgi:hypothetical protein